VRLPRKWSRITFKKRIITISLVLPLAMVSAVAYAGSIITDKSYWSNEAKRTTVQADTRYDQNNAFASGRTTPRFPIVPKAYEERHAWRYYGGPKSR